MAMPQLIADKRPLSSDLEARAKVLRRRERLPRRTERARTPKGFAHTMVCRGDGGANVAVARDNDRADFVQSCNDPLPII
jgi:hypothetical protein